MNFLSSPVFSVALAIVALVVGWQGWGWQGIALAVTLIVFWMILQFNLAIRTLRNAANAPIGHVRSAVMLNAKLRPGMTMAEVIGLTRSLGRKRPDAVPETYEWVDAGSVKVQVVMDASGRCASWTLQRPEEPAG